MGEASYEYFSVFKNVYFFAALGLHCWLQAFPSCSARASHCGGFSCCGAQAPGSWTSVVATHGPSSCSSWALEHRLVSPGARASWLCGLRDLPGSRIKLKSPALAGGFFTTEPPGKSRTLVLVWQKSYRYMHRMNSHTSVPGAVGLGVRDAEL